VVLPVSLIPGELKPGLARAADSTSR